jgi:hypothetical protein
MARKAAETMMAMTEPTYRRTIARHRGVRAPRRVDLTEIPADAPPPVPVAPSDCAPTGDPAQPNATSTIS